MCSPSGFPPPFPHELPNELFVYQFELLSKPPKQRTNDNPWPQWPKIFTSSGSHDEGGVREFGISTKKFNGKDGKLNSLITITLNFAN